MLVQRSHVRAAWSPPGYLLFARGGTLFAGPFDVKTFRLTGEPILVAEDVSSNDDNGRSSFAASDNGVLVYRSGELNISGQLTWYARDGKRLSSVGLVSEFQTLRLSPDERKAAVAVGPLMNIDTCIMELSTGVLTHLTTGAVDSINVGAWSPDSERLVINSASVGTSQLDVRSGKRTPLDKQCHAEDWAPDGRSILCTTGGGDLLTIPLESNQQPRAINRTSYRRENFRFSPDGKYLAYMSYESGNAQIFVASYPTFADKRQVSIDSGISPTWRKDGSELFFSTADNTLMSVEIRTGAKIEAGVPKLLFKFATAATAFWPSSDGQRFLSIEREQKSKNPEIMTVVNWPTALKQR
jgi:Tol biopolymer transport system component